MMIRVSAMEAFCYDKSMAEIKKKMWPEAYEKVLSGDKTYDIRLADWHIEQGDVIIFQEWDPSTKEYSGRELRKNVGYVGKTKDWQVWPKQDIEKHGYQIISLLDD
jgi:hypothetical protein